MESLGVYSVKDLLRRKTSVSTPNTLTTSDKTSLLSSSSNPEVLLTPVNKAVEKSDVKITLVSEPKKEESKDANKEQTENASFFKAHEKEITFITIGVVFLGFFVFGVYFATLESNKASASAISLSLANVATYNPSSWTRFNVSVSNNTAFYFPEGDTPGENSPYAAGEFLVVEVTLKSFFPDISGSKISIAVKFVFPTSWTDRDSPPSPLFSGGVSFGNTKLSFSTISSNVDFTFTDVVGDGTILEYPFNIFKLTQDMQAYIIGNDENVYPLNFVLAIANTEVSGYSHSGVVIPATNSKDFPKLVQTLERTTLSQIYPVLVIIMFWLISFGEMRIVFLYVFRYKKADNPSSLTLCAGIIFALPKLRDSLPGAPPVGALFDFYSFFWSEVIAVLVLFYFCYRWMVEQEPVSKKTN